MNANIPSCKQVKHDLTLLAGRDLTDHDRIEAVRRHVAVCPQCREKYRSLRNGLKALAANGSVAAVSGGEGSTWVTQERSLWPDLAQRLPSQAGMARPSTWASSATRNLPSLVAMVAACGVLAVVLFAPLGGNSPDVTVQNVNQPVTYEAPPSSPTYRNYHDSKSVPAESPSVFRVKDVIPKP